MSYVCVNCGNKLAELYKQYSSTVLKLAQCESCSEEADKYIEYDPVVTIIDLVLLNRKVYRHILYNTSFQNHWKLAIILLLVESYFEWAVVHTGESHKSALGLFDGEKNFYYACISSIASLVIFYSFLAFFTTSYYLITGRSKKSCDYLMLWKAVVLANFCQFFAIPWIIWGGMNSAVYKYFILSYSYFSQSRAYNITQKVPYFWTCIAVVSAIVLKVLCGSLVTSLS